MPADHITYDPQRVQAVLADPRRLRALERLQLLDTSADERFDRITRLASRMLATPICVMLVDDERQFIKSSTGDEQGASMPLTHSFCQYSIASSAPLRVADSALHPVLRSNGATIDLGIRAYLGVPLRASDGAVVGTLCAIGRSPREWTTDDQQVLEDLACAVVAEAELLASARNLKQVNTRLGERSSTMERLLDDLRTLRNRERTRLAGELHDGALQEVIAALMVLHNLKDDPTLHAGGLAMVERCLDAAVSSMRSTVDGLAPLQLRHSDIGAVLAETACEIGRCFDIDVEVVVEVEGRPVDAAHRALLYRATVELVRNACRHSGGAKVVASVARDEDGGLRLAVVDDGPGWGDAAPVFGAGLGLLSEEVHETGGTIRSGIVPEGFEVVVTVPASPPVVAPIERVRPAA